MPQHRNTLFYHFSGGRPIEKEEILAIIRFSARERAAFLSFGIQEELFLPLLLSIKSGGSWSYATDEKRSLAVKDVITYYDEKKKKGYTLEKIYLFIGPGTVKQEGEIHRLEKCGKKGERELVLRPYEITLRADRIILAEIYPAEKRIKLRELEEKELSLTGTPAYGAAHELEHLEKGEIQGLPLWNFEYERGQK